MSTKTEERIKQLERRILYAVIICMSAATWGAFSAWTPLGWLAVSVDALLAGLALNEAKKALEKENKD